MANLERVERAAARLRKASEAESAARTALVEHIRAAHSAGASASAIARAAGVSRQWISRVLEQRSG